MSGYWDVYDDSMEVWRKMQDDRIKANWEMRSILASEREVEANWRSDRWNRWFGR